MFNLSGLCECDVVSNECNESTPCLVQPIGSHCCEAMYFGCFGFRGELGFLNCDDVCMCIVNKQFDKISLTFTTASVCFCCVCGLSVRLL